MSKYTALFQIRLTATSPAPPTLHAFNFEADESQPHADEALKTSYKAGVTAMKKSYKQYKDFKRLSICEDMSHKILVNGSSIVVVVDGGVEA